MPKKGNIPWNKGKKNCYSKKQLKKMIISHKGKKPALGKHWKLSKTTKIKMSKARKKRRGENSPCWKGGITPLVSQIRHCFKYRQWRSDIFTRDNFTCQICGIKGGRLEAHHIKPFCKIIKEYQIKILEEALVCEGLWNINNGRTFCKKCHKKF